MSASLVVVILVAAGEARAPTTTTIVAAATDALGPTASLVVRETPTPSDVEALKLENQLQAAAVVRIVWTNSARTRVKLRLHRARTDRWVEREVAFLPEDTPRERSRALGFALGSMLLPESDARRRSDRVASDSRVPAPEPPAERSPAAPSESHEARQDEERQDAARQDQDALARADRILEEAYPENRSRDARGRRSASQADRDLAERERARESEREREGEVASRRSATEDTEPAPEPPAEPFAIDLTALGATGIGGPATGYGGGIQIERFVGHASWWAVKATARTGTVPAQNGKDLVASLMTGVTWRPFLPTAVHPFHFGAGLQVGMFFHNFSHQTPSPEAETRQRLVPGMAVLADGGWRISESWDAIVGVGLEVAFGVTTVSVAGRDVAIIPLFRGLAAAGVRFRF